MFFILSFAICLSCNAAPLKQSNSIPFTVSSTLERSFQSKYNKHSTKKQYSKMFVLADQHNEPIGDFPYKITVEDGTVYRGKTNEKGEAIRVTTGARSQTMRFDTDDASEEVEDGTVLRREANGKVEIIRIETKAPNQTIKPKVYEPLSSCTDVVCDTIKP